MFIEWFLRSFEAENEGATGGGAIDVQAPAAYDVDSAAARLTEVTQQQTTPRDEGGRFAAKEQPEAESEGEPESNVVDLATGKAPEAQAEEEDDDPEFEIPGEEGAEPARLKLSQIWEGYEEAQRLKTEVEKLRTQAREVPAEYTQALQDTIQARGQYLQNLELVSRFLQPQPPSQTLVDPRHPDYNPEAYHAQLQAFQRDFAALEAVNKERDQLTKHQREEYQALEKAYRAREQQALERVWPEYAKDETKAKFRSTLKEVYGFTDQEIAGILDHRQMLVIRDAMKFRELQAAQEKAVKVVRSKPKLVKGAARNTTDPKATQRTNAMARLQATGSMDAAAAAIKGLL